MLGDNHFTPLHFIVSHVTANYYAIKIYEELRLRLQNECLRLTRLDIGSGPRPNVKRKKSGLACETNSYGPVRCMMVGDDGRHFKLIPAPRHSVHQEIDTANLVSGAGSYRNGLDALPVTDCAY